MHQYWEYSSHRLWGWIFSLSIFILAEKSLWVQQFLIISSRETPETHNFAQGVWYVLKEKAQTLLSLLMNVHFQFGKMSHHGFATSCSSWLEPLGFMLILLFVAILSFGPGMKNVRKWRSFFLGSQWKISAKIYFGHNFWLGGHTDLMSTPEKSMKNVAQRRWPEVHRTFQSKVMAKIDLCVYTPLYFTLRARKNYWHPKINPKSINSNVFSNNRPMATKKQAV